MECGCLGVVVPVLEQVKCLVRGERDKGFRRSQRTLIDIVGSTPSGSHKYAW